MIEQYFTCTFKTDIVLHGSSNTEGKIDLLDFIPGSNFLGMVAKNYLSYKNYAFDVFHSGKVQFCDGHILLEDRQTYKVPLVYFTAKAKELEDGIYNHSFITKEKEIELKNENIQLKQLREGFITCDGVYQKLQHNYAQKSAYDKEKRRSKDGSMFGYYSLEKGSKFSFCIKFDDSLETSIKEKIINDIVGSHSLGKSKSAQYGSVLIELLESKPKSVKEVLEHGSKEMFLYIQNRLALTDEQGMPTLKPSLYNLKLTDGCEINLENTQIRTLTYAPYNGVRRVRDYERVMIEKGSVIAVIVPESFDINAYHSVVKNGIGTYKSEGFGQLLINPEFLIEQNPKLTIYDKNKQEIKLSDSHLSKWLQLQERKKEEEYELYKQVQEFIDTNYNKYKNSKTSQWGTIRTLSSITQIETYLNKGIAKEQWSGKVEAITKAIEKSSNHRKFIQLLAMEMSKKIKQDDKAKEVENV